MGRKQIRRETKNACKQSAIRTYTSVAQSDNSRARCCASEGDDAPGRARQSWRLRGSCCAAASAPTQRQ
eukprot:4307434-Pleurochrysis_carterae.AAC.1